MILKLVTLLAVVAATGGAEVASGSVAAAASVGGLAQIDFFEGENTVDFMASTSFERDIKRSRQGKSTKIGTNIDERTSKKEVNGTEKSNENSEREDAGSKASGVDTSKDADGLTPGEQLRQAATLAGYNISALDASPAGGAVDIAAPEDAPRAEALIGHRRRSGMRERLIGETFLGRPVPLDPRAGRRRPPGLSRRRSSGGLPPRPPRRHPRNPRRPPPPPPGKNRRTAQHDEFDHQATGPRIIFPEVNGVHDREKQKTSGKPNQRFPTRPHNSIHFDQRDPPRKPPSSFVGSNFKTETEFLSKPDKSSPFPGPPKISKNKQKFLPSNGFDEPTGFGPPKHILEEGFDEFHPFSSDFGNTDSSHFGPVIFDFDSEKTETFGKTQFKKTARPSFQVPEKTRFSEFPGSISFDSPEPFSPPSRPESVRPLKPISSSTIHRNHRLDDDFNSLDARKRGRCEVFTENICLVTQDYPSDAIRAALTGDVARSRRLVADVRNQSADDLVDGISARQEQLYDFGHYYGNRRQDTDGSRDFATDGGFLCPSDIQYARPQRARNSKGEWKFIVNMDKYTQTIRMEKCLNPRGACSYVSHHYRAECSQVHNYQRLLAWEAGRGLHMDIFKVPSCCTCHIQGYSFVFPPLDQRQSPPAAPSHPAPSRLSPPARPAPPARPNPSRRPSEASRPPSRPRGSSTFSGRHPPSSFNASPIQKRPFLHTRNPPPSHFIENNEIRRMDLVLEDSADVPPPDYPKRTDTQRPEILRADSREPIVRSPGTRGPDILKSDNQRTQTQRSEVRRSDIRRSDTRKPEIRRLDTRRPDTRRTESQRTDRRSNAGRTNFAPETSRPETRSTEGVNTDSVMRSVPRADISEDTEPDVRGRHSSKVKPKPKSINYDYHPILQFFDTNH